MEAVRLAFADNFLADEGFRLYLVIDCPSGRFYLCNNSTYYAGSRAGASG